jgi:hypothetical protein
LQKLLNWIDKNKLHCEYLSQNTNAINYIEQNPDKINWYWLSFNPNAIHYLEQNIDKLIRIIYQKIQIYLN